MAMPRLDATDDTTLISLKLPTPLLVKARREAVRRGDGNLSIVIRTLLRQWIATPGRPRAAKRRPADR